MLGKPEYQAFPFKLCRRENWSEKTKNKNKDKKKKQQQQQKQQKNSPFSHSSQLTRKCLLRRLCQIKKIFIVS